MQDILRCMTSLQLCIVRRMLSQIFVERTQKMGVRQVICLAMMSILLSLHTTDAYSTGPPVDQQETLCSDMTPQHGGSSQTSDPPYAISSATCYTPGQAVDGKTENYEIRICKVSGTRSVTQIYSF